MSVAPGKPTPAIDRYDNGTVRFKGTNLDGKMHGPWKFFRRDGSLMSSGSFDRGTQVGVWRTYDRTGNVVRRLPSLVSRPTRGGPAPLRKF